MGTWEITRIAEFILPFLLSSRKNKTKEERVRNHEIFHYFNLIKRQKLCGMNIPTKGVFCEIVEDYTPAFQSAIDENLEVLFSQKYWETFMKARQRFIPKNKIVEEEFFHLEKLIFQSLKDEVFENKYEFIYFVLTLYLLYLKIIVDIEGKCEE
ncbi:MAG: hypothetical protein WBG30_00120 [Psychrilyobacter sp.]|uniref:hypothetical protein n=1 Tax=Psychrilyobacter sp. TaxID=2586924 RepID=UPI003C71380D